MSGESRTWDRSLKPRWKIELEEAHDNLWLEAGPYQFICDGCAVKSTVELPAVRKRIGTKCPACSRFVNFEEGHA